MPQLMPLNWIFSAFMLLMVLVSAGIMYSEMMNMSEFKHNMGGLMSNLNIWCW